MAARGELARRQGHLCRAFSFSGGDCAFAGQRERASGVVLVQSSQDEHVIHCGAIARQIPDARRCFRDGSKYDQSFGRLGHHTHHRVQDGQRFCVEPERREQNRVIVGEVRESFITLR